MAADADDNRPATADDVTEAVHDAAPATTLVVVRTANDASHAATTDASHVATIGATLAAMIDATTARAVVPALADPTADRATDLIRRAVAIAPAHGRAHAIDPAAAATKSPAVGIHR